MEANTVFCDAHIRSHMLMHVLLGMVLFRLEIKVDQSSACCVP